MSTPQIDVAYIAKLARIDLTEEETALFSKDLDKVLAYILRCHGHRPHEPSSPGNGCDARRHS